MVIIFIYVLKQFQSCDKMEEIYEYETIMVAFILCIYSSLEKDFWLKKIMAFPIT